MKSINVRYRTLVPHGEGVKMLVKERQFTASTTKDAGYSAEGSSLLRFYGGGKSLMVPKAEILDVDIEE